jgi:aspartyl-tRNA(Asn)/glutamyl-tRNA(Gln) amidotransferase subunit A
MEWHRCGIAELHGLYGREETTPSAVIQSCLARISKLNPQLKAFVEIDTDGALRAALESDARFALGEQRPLEAIPVGIKANIAVAGLSHDAGMAARNGIRAQADAEVVARLREAGAIILGTLNMDEAALGATTDNPFFGQCINPHRAGFTPGGSSGGSAAAVAAGLCVLALGSDTLGSIRIPASYCGVFGLKPSFGKGSSDGLIPLAGRFDTIGPIARSMDDLVLASHVLFPIDLATAMRRARILGLGNSGGVDCATSVKAQFQMVLSEIPPIEEYCGLPSAASRIGEGAIAVTIKDLVPHLVALGEERCGQMSERLSQRIGDGLDRSVEEDAEDTYLMAAVGSMLRDAIGNNGILITPTTPNVAFAHSGTVPPHQCAFTALANIAGLPAISLPVGLDAEGLPIGLQLIGPVGGEALLFAQARMINDRIKGYAPPPAYW